MVVYSVDSSSIKTFMNNLLKGDMFDEFLVRSAEAETFVKFSIDGVLNKDYYADPIESTYCKWETLKPYFFELIKGSTKPKYMKIVFSMSPEETALIDENASALFINILFTTEGLICTTGCGQKQFSLSKTLDIVWDNYVHNFLKQNNIVSTQPY